MNESNKDLCNYCNKIEIEIFLTPCKELSVKQFLKIAEKVKKLYNTIDK